MDSDKRLIFEQFMQDFMAREKRTTLERYHRLNRVAQKGQTVLVGSSLMEQFPFYELKMSLGIPGTVYNRGIGGYTTAELLQVMDTCIFDLEPSRVFINIGSNDMAALGFTVDGLRDNYRQILAQIKQRLPACRVTLMAYYPINDSFSIPGIDPQEFFATRNNKTILACNRMAAELADQMGCAFINVNLGLYDENGSLKGDFTVEGLHMWPDAYLEVFKALRPYLEE
jgi:lysophospholipase L1-like esterase